MKLDIIKTDGKKAGTLDVNTDVFDGTVKETLFHELVTMQMANRRAGTASTKGRSEVKGSGAKPWRQKGTGRARAGRRSSPIWRHGGVTFGPKPRDYSYSVPKKVKAAALVSAIALKIRDNKIKVFEKLEIADSKSKLLAAFLKKQKIENALIVVEADDKNLRLAARNLKGFKYILSAGINVYDILLYDELVMTSDALKSIEGRLK